MLAREYCDAAGIKLKPVILSHHMLYGLKQGQAKMSKSDPDSAIFMEDSRSDIARKLNQAFCPREAPAAKKVADGELRLVVDVLENPCLDYVEHIVLAGRKDASFTAGGTTYAAFADVKAAFLSGSLSEADIKAALVDAVDALVAPVRDHFTRDPEAKALLARIAEYKKEDATAAAAAAAAKPLRRLSLGPAGALTGCHLVVSPLPSPVLPLGTALTVLKKLRCGPPGVRPVLWLPDWSALVTSCCGGDVKAIRAAFVLLVEAVKALDKALPGNTGDGKRLSDVTVLFQSEAILADPSDYWISVINVGRALKLNELKPGFPNLPQATTADASGASEDGEGGGVSEPAGLVVAALMSVGDVLGLCPATIACDASDAGTATLAASYWAAADVASRNGLSAPTPAPCTAVSTWLAKDGAPRVTGCFQAGPATEDDYAIGDEPKAGANKKMKRAFCEPGNVGLNPPLRIATDVLLGLGGVGVSVEGKAYGPGDGAAMEADFAADSLTPQRLKPALTAAVAGLLDAVNAAVRASPEAKKADATLRALLKGSGKKGK